MKTVRTTAKTIEAAVEEGLKQLGISKEEAIIEVVEEPTGGMFGLFGKKAVVQVSLKNVAETESLGDEVPKSYGVAKSPEEPEEKARKVSHEEVSVDEEDKKVEKEDLFDAEEQAQVALEARAFLENIFRGMGLDVTLEKMVNRERILFNLHGEGLGILIGKRGQTLDALQYLTNLAAGKNVSNHYFVLLDVENYRERRQRTLESLAHRLADKAKRTGEPVKLEPMSAGERRIIHLALQDDSEISTESVGEAPHRYVVIQAKINSIK